MSNIWQAKPWTCPCLLARGIPFRRGPQSRWRGTVQLRCAQETAATTETKGKEWDPEGILPPPPSESHFARRERKRTTQWAREQAEASKPQVVALPPELQAGDGVAAADSALYDQASLSSQLQQRFLPVDLAFPGLRVRHLDPPVLTVERFFSPEECDDMIGLAEESGLLQTSRVGAGHASEGYAANSRRTSSSMLADPLTLAGNPRLRSLCTALQERAWRLLSAGDGDGWGPQGRLPAPGQLCYESLQIARYQAGQHFLPHEDGFPAELAAGNGFQRRATLLVYLNDVAAGGATRFDHLGFAVQPQKGSALLFFPAFSDDSPDARTLHQGEDAEDTKWIAQQWVACGVGAPAPAGSPVGSVTQAEPGTGPAFEELVASRAKRRPAEKKKKAAQAPAKRGFGSR